jgi:aryl-alcohol dehydrogenase-like predicted oxidoreductase
MKSRGQREKQMAMRRRLGKTDIEITPVGLGCWQFSAGMGLAGKFWEKLSQSTVDQVVEASLTGGINWFDTAEMYGNGASERALADALKNAGKTNGDVVVATKWSPIFRTAKSIRSTLQQRLNCLAPFAIDLHQVHNPLGFSSVEAEMSAMASLVADKKIRAVGVSNFSVSRMRRAHAALAKCGLMLASNQVRYSLLDRRVESNGTLLAARDLGVSIIAYSPLEQGILTGKYHRNPEYVRTRPGPRKWMGRFRTRGLERSRRLVEELAGIAHAYGATSGQIALAWLYQFDPNVVVIPGASRVEQAVENRGALELTLSRRELDKLDQLSRQFM